MHVLPVLSRAPASCDSARNKRGQPQSQGCDEFQGYACMQLGCVLTGGTAALFWCNRRQPAHVPQGRAGEGV